MSECHCSRCQHPQQFRTHMILCPTCGNKRCPRADWHGYECTGSNELGQVGKMTLAQAYAVLAEHQEWRRGGDGPHLHPKTIGEALDLALVHVKAML